MADVLFATISYEYYPVSFSHVEPRLIPTRGCGSVCAQWPSYLAMSAMSGRKAPPASIGCFYRDLHCYSSNKNMCNRIPVIKGVLASIHLAVSADSLIFVDVDGKW